MNEKSEREVVNFPGPEDKSEAGRQARVRALKKRIEAGQYRLDARAVAEAMVAEGVINVAPMQETPSADDEDALRRAMERFLISGESSTSGGEGERPAASA